MVRSRPTSKPPTRSSFLTAISIIAESCRWRCAGFAGPIYCTPATAEVARIVLADSAKIQEEDVNYIAHRSRNPGEPAPRMLYGVADVPNVIKRFQRIPYQQKTDLGKGVSFTFFDAGHILGSAYVLLEWNEGNKPRTLIFTADVGRYDAPILRDPQVIPGPVSMVITESTYGNTSHGPMAAVGPQFLDAVKTCIAKKSRMIVPSFAVGRTQTVLWYLEQFVAAKQIPAIPVFVDSPMGVEVTRVHSQFRENYDEQTNQMIGKGDLFSLLPITFASSPDESKRINRQSGPCVIIASSPTCEFGRVLHHLTQSVENPDNLIVFCGWIPPQTLGRRIQDRQPRIRIYDRWYDLKCQVRTIHGLSAHADGDELLRFLRRTLTDSTEFFVVHGEVDQAEGFAQRLLANGAAAATVPAIETSIIAFAPSPAAAKSEPRAADAE